MTSAFDMKYRAEALDVKASSCMIAEFDVAYLSDRVTLLQMHSARRE